MGIHTRLISPFNLWEYISVFKTLLGDTTTKIILELGRWLKGWSAGFPCESLGTIWSSEHCQMWTSPPCCNPKIKSTLVIFSFRELRDGQKYNIVNINVKCYVMVLYSRLLTNVLFIFTDHPFVLLFTILWSKYYFFQRGQFLCKINLWVDL